MEPGETTQLQLPMWRWPMPTQEIISCTSPLSTFSILGSPWSKTSGYYVNEAEGPKKGPDLPGPLRSHCSLTVDTGESYVVWAIGGLVGEIEDHEHDGVATDQTLYFDLFNDKTWTVGK